jgi:predicted transcriptional regulator
LIEVQMRILKFMSEVTGRMDMSQFACRIGLTSSKTIEKVQELVKAGFVKKIGSDYCITEKGKNALKAETPVPAGKEFYFYSGIGVPTGLSASSIRDFYELAKLVDAVSLEFHLYREDFENWLRSVVNEAPFADELLEIRKSELKGENLRKEIIRAAEARYAL